MGYTMSKLFFKAFYWLGIAANVLAIVAFVHSNLGTPPTLEASPVVLAPASSEFDHAPRLSRQEFEPLASGKQLGVSLADVTATKFQSLLAFEEMLGRNMNYLLMFQAWGDGDTTFPQEMVTYLRQLEIIPIFTFEPWQRNFSDPAKYQPEFALSSIIEGEFDDQLISWAVAARDSGLPEIVVRFAQEMSTPLGMAIWYPWQGDPGMYVSAYRHVVDVFRSQSADNVKFMWNPIIFYNDANIDSYYPGEKYVDNIGLTVINMGEITGGKGEDYGWVGCDFLIQEQMSAVRGYHKPVIIAELLSNDIGGDKATWYSECLSMAINDPTITAIISVQTKPQDSWSTENVDWRVNSSLKSLSAFRKELNQF